MERENVYFEDVPEKVYKAPNAWGACFVDSADKEKAMKNFVYVVTATDTMDYEQGRFGETVKVFLKRSDALKWIKEQRAEQKEWPKPIRDVFTYKKFEVV